MKGLTLNVSQLNEYVRKSLASDPMLRNLCLKGELSNLKQQASGHWYFTLKDADAAINCAMFRQAACTVRFKPQNGQQVRLFGSVGLYSKTGSYQFYADAMEPDGLGDLYLQFEALKARLNAEGLFDAALKKPLPLLPRGIGIVTSKTGAVVHDITRVAWRRNPGISLYLCPVKVQGDGAAEEIIQAIHLLDALDGVDVIIVGRGGGSMEDLWAFNEEGVARAISACQTPVISAVGHETDFTIADFVSDLRAPTPSAAAELAVVALGELKGAVSVLEDQISRNFDAAWSRKWMRLAQLQQRLSNLSPEQQSIRALAKIQTLTAQIEARMEERVQSKTHALENAWLRLKTTGPMHTIERGYAVVTNKLGKVIKSVDSLKQGDALCVRLSDGRAGVTVMELKKGEE
ncbi:MAG: exodeoxyribonuclease VII large subunit [Clostridia bacterium]